MRVLGKLNVDVTYLPQVLVKMRIGGMSNKNLWHIAKANIQCFQDWQKNGLKVSPLTILRKPFSKISQFIYAED